MKEKTWGSVIYKNIFQEWSWLRVLPKSVGKCLLSLNTGMQLILSNNNKIIKVTCNSHAGFKILIIKSW